MTWYRGLNPWGLRYVYKLVSARIISLSLLFFIQSFRIVLQSYKHITYIYILPLFDVIGNHPHRYDYILPQLVSPGSNVTQNTIFVFLLSIRSVYGTFFLVGYTPFLFIFRCPIVLFMDLPKCFLVRLSYSPGHYFRKPCLVSFRRIVLVGLNSAA